MDSVSFLMENVGVGGISFGIGCIVTYGFCMRTFIKTANDSRISAKEEIKALKQEVKDVREKYEKFILDNR